jgi:SAM-dependent methyltransferase
MTSISADDAAAWDRAYTGERRAPWDIGRPQPVFVSLADAGEIGSLVLDSGCGSGENALMLAERGLEVVGVDVAPTAIAKARGKAADRGLSVEFLVGDVLNLVQVTSRTGTPRFATVIDAGCFHVFDDAERAQYVESLAAVIQPGGVVHVLCFSDQVPGTLGPRRISKADLLSAFADGWTVERIEDAEFDVNPDFPLGRPHAWLARIVRETGAAIDSW